MGQCQAHIQHGALRPVLDGGEVVCTSRSDLSGVAAEVDLLSPCTAAFDLRGKTQNWAQRRHALSYTVKCQIQSEPRRMKRQGDHSE